MNNWKTTVAGIVAAVAIAVQGCLQAGKLDTKSLLLAAAIAALGVLSKDFDFTGGNRGPGNVTEPLQTPSPAPIVIALAVTPAAPTSPESTPVAPVSAQPVVSVPGVGSPGDPVVLATVLPPSAAPTEREQGP